jgi:hypothetical protein
MVVISALSLMLIDGVFRVSVKALLDLAQGG